MSKIVTGVWNHKKKIIFFSGLTAWGSNYGLEKKRIHDEMQILCLQAKVFGDMLIKPGQAVRRAVVILNHGAHKSKARKLYENYAAPLLNLAGIQTTVYTTNDTTKLREYLANIEATNALIFAGGDSTVFECIQSCLSLEKAELLETPVGILPLGYSNVVYNSLRPDDSREAIKIAHATMHIVQGYVTPTDVLEIKIGEKEAKDYAIAGVQWGPLKDVENTVPKYWYFGPFDAWFAYGRALFKGKLKEISVTLRYANACAGCARCQVLQNVAETESTADKGPQAGSRTWWQSVIPRQRLEVFAEPLPDIPRRPYPSVNEDCGVMHGDINVSTKDLHLLSKSLLDTENKGNGFFLTFLKNGAFTSTQQVRQRHRQIHNVKKYADAEKYEKLDLSEVKITASEGDLALFPTIEIDGHNVDITGPVHAKIHSKKLLLFNRRLEFSHQGA